MNLPSALLPGPSVRGQLTSAAPCVTAGKQQEEVRPRGAAAGGSEEPEPSRHAGGMTISSYVGDERGTRAQRQSVRPIKTSIIH